MNRYEVIKEEAYKILADRHNDEFQDILTSVINDVKRNGGITR